MLFRILLCLLISGLLAGGPLGCSPNDPLIPDPTTSASALSDGYEFIWADGERGRWRRLKDEYGHTVGHEFQLRTLERGDLYWRVGIEGPEAWRVVKGVRQPNEDPFAIREELDQRLQTFRAKGSTADSGQTCSLAQLENLMREFLRNCGASHPAAGVVCAFSMAEVQWCISGLGLALEEATEP